VFRLNSVVIFILLLLPSLIFSSTVKLNLENDLIGSRDDDHYTNGFQLSYIHSLDETYELKASIGMNIGHQMFTPTNKGQFEPIVGDMPYSGLMYTDIYLILTEGNTYYELGTKLSKTGENTYGQEMQDWWHETVNDGKFLGWGNQIPERYMYDVYFSYGKKTEAKQISHGYVDFISTTKGSVGKLFTGMQQGVSVRFSSFENDSFFTNGNMLFSDDVELLDLYNQEGFNWDVSFGMFGGVVEDYYILDYWHEKYGIIDETNYYYGWNGSFNLYDDNFKYTYQIKHIEFNNMDRQRWGGLIISYSF